MGHVMLTKSGRLRESLLPAMYLDTSVVIDYWRTEGMEMPETEIEVQMRSNELPHLQVVRDILKSEEHIAMVAEIRKKLYFDECTVTPVISPLSLLELMEQHAEAAFKNIAAQAAGVSSIQRRGKKDISRFLKKALELRKEEVQQQAAKKQPAKGEKLSTGLEMLMIETWLNRSFEECHGLSGLVQVDIVNFGVALDKVWQEPFAYAYLQLGLADIMHILLAEHLGCKYIASFDSDFDRVKDIIEEECGMRVLKSAQDILAIL